jgi:hypothetical protein
MALNPTSNDLVYAIFVRVSFDNFYNPIHRLLQGFPAMAGVLNPKYAT